MNLLYLRPYLRIFAVSSSPDRTASVSSTVSSSSDRTAPYLPPYLRIFRRYGTCSRRHFHRHLQTPNLRTIPYVFQSAAPSVDIWKLGRSYRRTSMPIDSMKLQQATELPSHGEESGMRGSHKQKQRSEPEGRQPKPPKKSVAEGRAHLLGGPGELG